LRIHENHKGLYIAVILPAYLLWSENEDLSIDVAEWTRNAELGPHITVADKLPVLDETSLELFQKDLNEELRNGSYHEEIYFSTDHGPFGINFIRTSSGS